MDSVVVSLHNKAKLWKKTKENFQNPWKGCRII